MFQYLLITLIGFKSLFCHRNDIFSEKLKLQYFSYNKIRLGPTCIYVLSAKRNYNYDWNTIKVIQIIYLPEIYIIFVPVCPINIFIMSLRTFYNK